MGYLEPGLLIVAVGALAQLTLAGLVYAARPRDWTNRFFAMFVSSNAFWDFSEATAEFSLPATHAAGWDTIDVATTALATLALIGFLGVYPRPVRGLDSGVARLGLAAAGVASIILAVVVANPMFREADGVVTAGPLMFLGLAWFPALLIGAVLAARRLDHDPAAPYLLLGFLAYPMFALQQGLGALFGTWPSGGNVLGTIAIYGIGWTGIAALILIPALPIFAIVRCPGRRVPLTLIFITMLAIHASIVWRYVREPPLGIEILSHALPLTFAALLAFAVLRHQLLDIDLKLKFTIRQSTLASIFVAVFFVVSEGTQELVGGTAAGPAIGILAAGGLLFALAPLQRVADRVASAAVPAAADPELLSKRAMEIYVAAASSALSDGNITPKERMMLATLQDELGLTARQTLALEDQVR